MNEELNLTTTEEIQNLIYTIRGKQVMIDSDVANLYHYETKRINEAVKRNKDRFPNDFCFRLTLNEFRNLKSQFATSSLEKQNEYGGRRKLPLVFTEQGIAMLAPLLKNKIAVQVSINIMNAFVRMRHFLKDNGQLFERVTTLEYQQIENNKKFDLVFDQLQEKQIENRRIFYNGQIYDAYILILKIIKKAENKITIIDNYIDESVLEMLSKKKENVQVVILTSNNSNIKNIDIQKFNKQYPLLKVGKTEKFHDRFIIIDEKELYHLGASIKDLGKKCFAINKIDNEEFIELVKNIK
ncbi:MAG: ORF6N domain-containing protein [Clostridia bacterium]|nr:ORF6N domain-containing protein [Clostridia bacterium]